MRAKALDFRYADDATDWLTANGYYRFAERTYQHRHNGKTAHITCGSAGRATVTIL
jgi:hypothetical protein